MADPILDSTPAVDSALTVLVAFRAARATYEDAVTCDGVTSTAWWTIAGALHATADDLEAIAVTNTVRDLVISPGTIQCHRDRARDAEHRALYATRMVQVARAHRVIDMATVGGAL